MRVVVRGLGNIGTTLSNLLIERRAEFGIDQLVLHKGKPVEFERAALGRLEERGALVLRGPESLDAALESAHYVFDCRAAGAPRADHARYRKSTSLIGACAQGTEEGFGVPYVAGINDEAISSERFVQIASCNTHATCTLVSALSAGNPASIVADFVVVRRSEDLGSHDRHVSATVVARHRDPSVGTHHASDARRVFETLGVQLQATSSDATTPSQLMHSVRFSIRFDAAEDAATIAQRVDQHPYLSSTELFDSNKIFELGRRYGEQGRIFEHAIVVSNNLLVHTSDGATTIAGWAFVPQEGNTLLSTLNAFLLQTSNPRRAELLASLKASLLSASW